MTIGAFARGFAGLALLSTTVMPSFAASAETEAFLANMRLRAVFVAQASRMAAERAGSQKTRDFASAEAAQQAALLGELEAAPAAAPHDAVADLAQPKSGRSVGRDAAIDITSFAPPAGFGALMPAAAISLDQLAALKGEAFDQTYASLMRGVLGDEASFCSAYSRTGDDEAIRAIAGREALRTNTTLAALD